MEDIFDKDIAKLFRKFIIDNVEFTDGCLPYDKAFYAVMNPTNYCPVGCPHCIYSSLKNEQTSEYINAEEMDKFIKIANQAGLKMLVFSGGGEPFENLPAMIRGIEQIRTLKDVVIITSGYFASSKKSVDFVLGKVLKAASTDRAKSGLDPVAITMRVSRDNSQCHSVPLSSVANILDYVIKKNDPSKIRALVRTILDFDQNNDVQLAKDLNLDLLPNKKQNDIYDGLPTIDGLPTRWLVDKKTAIEIPVIYKPTYFLGRGIHAQAKNIHSLWSVIESEERSGTPLNLCIRGPKGQGHNYYETIFLGYREWAKTTQATVDAPKSFVEKGLAIYVPASGNILINNGAPDIAPSLKRIKDWDHYLKIIYSDPVNRLLIEEGPFFIENIAEKVEKNIVDLINKSNFVFSVSLQGLITPQLRLFLTIRAVRHYMLKGKIRIKDEIVDRIIKLDAASLYARHKESYAEDKKSRYLDPITGDAENIALKRMSSLRIRKIFSDIRRP